MRSYDMENVGMKSRRQMLALEVPGLAEKRPSLVSGDFIFVKLATDDEAWKPYQVCPKWNMPVLVYEFYYPMTLILYITEQYSASIFFTLVNVFCGLNGSIYLITTMFLLKFEEHFLFT